ncbi:glycosyltransferase family 2 protein [Liquorilactobacillus uvarum]|nr:cellulose synthase catalytic subunit [Liquorilactobacillus uvarum]
MEKIFYFDLVITVVLFIFYFLAKKNIFFKKVLIIIYFLTMFSYLGWRIFYTLPLNGLINSIFGILLLIAEIGGFLLSIIFYILFFKKNKKEKPVLNKLSGHYPTIDVYIATYNEDEMILKRSIVAAKKLRYPEKDKVNVYVLDDGSRENVKILAARLGALYIKRENHEHAKAGNLNNALQYTDGELIVTLDADMVVRTDFLERTIGYFADLNIGFIQSPQTFFNNDPYQFNLFSGDNIGNDQDFFMRNIEEQKDRFNATMYIGSNAVFRRKALEDIGGFSTGVITEDMATGMLIQSKGWQTRYVNENLASGLAPETFGDLIKQRDRWARGNIQVARKWNPLRIKGLNAIQKVIYLDGIHYWISSIYKMIYLLAPIAFLLFGFYSLNASFQGILFFWFPSFLSSQLAFNIVSEGRLTVLLTNIYETAMAPYISYAVISEGVFKAKNKFVVTRKGLNFKKPYYNLKLAAPILVLLALSVISLVKILLISNSVLSFNQPMNTIYINLFWIIYNLFALILASFIPFERPRFRKAERFATNKNIQVFSIDGHRICTGLITNWNEIGANIIVDKDIKIDKNIVLDIENHKISAQISRLFPLNEKKINLGLEFKNLSNKEYAYIITQTYALDSNKHVDPVYESNIWKIIPAFIKGYR